MYAARSRTIPRSRAISARVASSFCWVASISAVSAASRCAAWSTCALSWVSICWYWLTWFASAAKASGSGFGVVEDAGALVVVVAGLVVEVVVDDEVVVDESWATAAVAG